MAPNLDYCSTIDLRCDRYLVMVWVSGVLRTKKQCPQPHLACVLVSRTVRHLQPGYLVTQTHPNQGGYPSGQHRALLT